MVKNCNFDFAISIFPPFPKAPGTERASLRKLKCLFRKLKSLFRMTKSLFGKDKMPL